MGRLAPATVLVASLAWGVSACDYISSVNNQANQAYHASRWQAVVQACVSGEAYQVPAGPTVPRVCQGTVDTAYPEVANRFNATKPAWEELVYQAEVDLAFVAEMLGVLQSRNTISIEQLAPQITSFMEQTDTLEEDWRDTLEQAQLALDNLQDSWETLWPQNGLHFDLEQQVTSQLAGVASEVSGIRREALEHYHQNEFSRMAQKYLGFEPVDFQPQPESHVPQGCAGVEEAHFALDTALLVRYGLDLAIEQDVELISRLAKVDLSNQSWDDIKVPKGRYGEKRVSAAIARLKLLKYLDTLVTDSLGIIIRDVGLEWDMVWPGHNLETNIFEYAGVPKVDRDQ